MFFIFRLFNFPWISNPISMSYLFMEIIKYILVHLFHRRCHFNNNITWSLFNWHFIGILHYDKTVLDIPYLVLYKCFKSKSKWLTVSGQEAFWMFDSISRRKISKRIMITNMLNELLVPETWVLLYSLIPEVPEF